MKIISEYINPHILIVVANCLQVFIAVYIGLNIYRLLGSGYIDKQYRNIRKTGFSRLTQALVKSENKGFNYRELEDKLNKYGYKFYYKGITPQRYLIYKFIMAIAFTIAFVIMIGVLSAPIGFLIGYFLIDVYTKDILNKRDNAEIIDDIRVMLSSIKIQTKTNVYITDSIMECYYDVKNARLKQAILELCGSIRAKEGIDDALDIMASKFDNNYITSLCSAIKQMMHSGVISNTSDSITKQMENIQKASIEKQNAKIDRDKIVCTAIVFAFGAILLFAMMSDIIIDSANMI